MRLQFPIFNERELVTVCKSSSGLIIDDSCPLAGSSLSPLRNWRSLLVTCYFFSKKTTFFLQGAFPPDACRSSGTGSRHPLVLEPTLSVPQSGLREHRWTLILSWLFHITAEMFEFILGHRRKPAKIPPTPPGLRSGLQASPDPSQCSCSRLCVCVCLQQEEMCLSGVCAAAGVVNQADDTHLL